VYGAVNGLDTCGNQDTGEIYGDNKYLSSVVACVSGHSQTCLCVNGGQSDTCYLFNLDSADNCGQILTKMPALLITSVIFLAILFVIVLTYSAFTCKAVCCGRPAAPAAGTNSSNPAPASATAVAHPVGNKM
jgi:hypothetical protein